MGDISGVYKIMNVETGKFYIGSSKNIKQRFKEHIDDLESGWHSSEDMQNDWIKYGRDKFTFDILLETDYANAKKFEQEYIDKFQLVRFGYNGGKGKCVDNKISKYKRLSEYIYQYIKPSFNHDGCTYAYDFFKISSYLKMKPTKLMNWLGVDKHHRFNSCVKLDLTNENIYVGINWDDYGVYLCAISDDVHNEKGDFIIIDDVT